MSLCSQGASGSVFSFTSPLFFFPGREREGGWGGGGGPRQEGARGLFILETGLGTPLCGAGTPAFDTGTPPHGWSYTPPHGWSYIPPPRLNIEFPRQLYNRTWMIFAKNISTEPEEPFRNLINLTTRNPNPQKFFLHFDSVSNPVGTSYPLHTS